MFKIHNLTPGASCDVSLNGSDADRVHAGIVTQATLTVVGSAGEVYLTELGLTNGFYDSVTQADVDSVTAVLASYGETVVHVVWGERDDYGNSVGDRRR